MNKKQLNKLAEEWIQKNGACSFDFKNKEINLCDGGLFSIVEKKVMLHKVRGYKKLPNGCSEVIFSKAKYPTKTYDGNIWFEDIDDIINYFKRMKKLLNELGYKTGCTIKRSYVKKLLKQIKRY